MSDPKFTIRITFAEIFGTTALVPLKDFKEACKKYNVDMGVVKEGKYFEFTTDDPKFFFLLGLNFPK